MIETSKPRLGALGNFASTNGMPWQVLFHRATQTVRNEMIYRSFKHFSQKHADNFVPLPYQPENNDIPVQTPPTGFDALRPIAVNAVGRLTGSSGCDTLCS